MAVVPSMIPFLFLLATSRTLTDASERTVGMVFLLTPSVN